MSLAIIAYAPEEAKKRKDKFKEKYGLSYEKFNDWMLTPSKDTFFYFLHPEFLKDDTKKYEEMEKDADKFRKKRNAMKIKTFVQNADNIDEYVNNWLDKHQNLKIKNSYMNSQWIITKVDCLSKTQSCMVTMILEYEEEKGSGC